jgi:hypothetical protein
MKKNLREKRAQLVQFCSLGILLVLLVIALAPSPASAIPQKESSGPALGDPDGPDQSPTPGPAKAATLLDRSGSQFESFMRADLGDRKASRADWLWARAFGLFTILRVTLGKYGGN